jgi:hypothetical protein
MGRMVAWVRICMGGKELHSVIERKGEARRRGEESGGEERRGIIWHLTGSHSCMLPMPTRETHSCTQCM